jgi:hypothetical protein
MSTAHASARRSKDAGPPAPPAAQTHDTPVVPGAHQNKAEVADYAGAERAASRAYLRTVARDPAAADEVADPQRAVARPCFADKTSPMYAFLDSRVGKSWAKTYALIRERFDVRTTPGRHILQGHLLAEIALHGKNSLTRLGSRYSRYYVDRGGVLRKTPRSPRRHRPPEPTGPSGFVVAAWLGNRKVGRMGARLVWFVPAHSRDARYVRAEYVPGASVYDSFIYANIPFRQERVLDSDEERFFRSLSESLQAALLCRDPGGRPLRVARPKGREMRIRPESVG